MSVRNHRNPYIRKPKAAPRKVEPSRKRDRESNRAALSSELRNLIRVSFVEV